MGFGPKHDKITPMKSYTLEELRTFVARYGAELEGSRLQEIVSNDRGLALGFYSDGLRWLLVDLTPSAPLVFVMSEKEMPWTKSPRTKPIGLFLSAQAKGKILDSFRLNEEQGRVLVLEFVSHRGDCLVEIQLIPKHPNFVAHAENKTIHWSKPKELAAAPTVETLPAPRDLDAVRGEWLAELKGVVKPADDPEAQWRKKRDRDLEKKRKALAEITKQLAADGADEWARRGEELKGGAALFDASKSRSWNIEEAFRKAKQLKAKREGTIERRKLVSAEIAALESAVFTMRDLAPAPKSALKQAGAKGRTLELTDGATAFVGRSAADNLSLLRKARAWDLWLHLRDYPGAHAIIKREKNRALGDRELEKVAQWLAKESLSSKVRADGLKLEVVMTECRFVRPIKGDKLGRVNYQNERHFFVVIS